MLAGGGTARHRGDDGPRRADRGRVAAPSSPDFGPLAASYDRLRPVDENWLELLAALVAAAGGVAGKRALDVGCGTGRLAEALAERGARVWGVDPSEEMLSLARETTGTAVGWKRGEAERLPFKSDWFDLAFLRLVIHLVDRAQVLPELRRVLGPGGRAVVATFDPRHFGSFWLTRFLPSVERIDRARFPEPGLLAAELAAAGFEEVAVQPLEERSTMTREQALERIRGRYISTLHLLGDDELAAGLAQAERELPPEIEIELHWAVVSAST